MKTILLCMSLVLLAACNGNNSNRTELAIYLTDSFRDDYDHVWLHVLKAEVRHMESNEFKTVFSDLNGRLVDAKTLRDGLGEIFSFLSVSTLPNGTYDALRVTFAPTAVLVLSGELPGQTFELENAVITKEVEEFSIPGEELVIDLDLENFTVNGSSLALQIDRAENTSIDQKSRHLISLYKGTVSRISETGFILTGTHGNVEVRFDADTPVLSARTGLLTLLKSAAASVRVFGIFLAGQRYLSASKIVIEDEDGSDAYVLGNEDNIDLNANTMQLIEIRNPEGFQPEAAMVHVSWSSNTEFRKSGVLLNEEALNQFPICEVKGIYNVQTNTIEAKRVVFENENNVNYFARTTGIVSNLNLVSRTALLLNLTQTQGFSPLINVNVSWNSDTLFLRNQQSANELALVGVSSVRIYGFYVQASNTLKASKVIID